MSSGSASTTSGAASQDEVYPTFLGRGWSFPPTFNQLTTSVDMSAAEEDIREALWIILSTMLGERVMVPNFGCDLISKVFTALTTTAANEIAQIVTRAIVEWEPRVKVLKVTATDAPLDGWIDIGIEYMVIQTNTRSNIVYPFYRLEATVPPPPA